MDLRLATSQMTIVESSLPDARSEPSGLNATVSTFPVGWSFPSVARGDWVARSHRMTVLSRLPVASSFPLGLNATLTTSSV